MYLTKCVSNYATSKRTQQLQTHCWPKKCWELLRPFCFKLCATTCDRECKRTQHVHLTTLGVGGQQCCVRLHGALVTSAEHTRPAELSWFLHYKKLGTLKGLGRQSDHSLIMSQFSFSAITCKLSASIRVSSFIFLLILKSITRHIPCHYCTVLALFYAN